MDNGHFVYLLWLLAVGGWRLARAIGEIGVIGAIGENRNSNL